MRRKIYSGCVFEELVGEHFRDIRPANTTVICALTKPEMKVEIEVTARRQTNG